MFPELDLHYQDTDPARHLITVISDLDYLAPDLFDV